MSLGVNKLNQRICNLNYDVYSHLDVYTSIIHRYCISNKRKLFTLKVKDSHNRTETLKDATGSEKYGLSSRCGSAAASNAVRPFTSVQ